jgi:hypothetical protein
MGASLNLRQTLTGSFQSSPGVIIGTTPAALWSLTQTEFSVTDPGAVVRAEMGDLPARGVSPAQWGFRANDGSGNPIFDSLGLIAVMQPVGGTPLFGGDTWTGNTGGYIASPLSGTKVTFSLPRTLRILAMCQTEYQMSNTTQFGNLAIMVDGAIPGGYTPIAVGNVSATGPGHVTFIWSASLAGGTHTFDLAGQVLTGGWQLSVSVICFLFQLGS